MQPLPAYGMAKLTQRSEILILKLKSSCLLSQLMNCY